MKKVKISDGVETGSGLPLCIIAGPCVIEEYSITLRIAETLKKITDKLGIPYIFKASYDKANRTSITSFRGPGIDEGLEILAKIKKDVGVPVTSDIHLMEEAEKASEVLDLIQIPAFLSRQTDFITAAARTGKPVNIKKGQFLAPWDMENVIRKAETTGNSNLLITERGVSFGYNNLVADMRSIPIMQRTGYPVVFDATHSVQLPGGQGGSSGGNREFAPVLARAAVAAGADAVFMEIHPDPDRALCDGPNSLRLDDAEKIIRQLSMIRKIILEQESR